MKSTLAFGVLVPLLACTAPSVHAQYRCTTSSGGVYASQQPCPSPELVYYGPVTAPANTRRTQLPERNAAPDTLKYLSARCAGLNDAIRTAPSRGLQSIAISDLRRDYQRQCGEEEADAYRRLSKEQRDARRAREEDQKASAKAQQQEAERAHLRSQQCIESKRIITTKRARTDLNDGERADLARFEENYRARCLQPPSQ